MNVDVVMWVPVNAGYKVYKAIVGSATEDAASQLTGSASFSGLVKSHIRFILQ